MTEFGDIKMGVSSLKRGHQNSNFLTVYARHMNLSG